MGTSGYAPPAKATAAKAAAAQLQRQSQPAVALPIAAFEPVKSLELVLRRAGELPYARASAPGGDRDVKRTAGEFITYIREATELARAAGVDLAKSADRLSSALGAVQVALEFLMGELAEHDPASASIVSATITPLLALMPGDILALAPRAGAPAPITEQDNIELCNLAIAAARKHLESIPSAAGPDAREQLIAFARPLEAHLLVARDAALGIADRRKRWKLTAAVELLGQRMGELAGILSMEPKLAWHRSFAAAFDAENALRVAIGTIGIPRPYSGHIDPAMAKIRLSELAHGSNASEQSSEELDPDTAVTQAATRSEESLRCSRSRSTTSART